jgi:hypothetical protein
MNRLPLLEFAGTQTYFCLRADCHAQAPGASTYFRTDSARGRRYLLRHFAGARRRPRVTI